jgi:hypothetical protein
MNHRVPQNIGNFSVIWGTISFSRRTLFCTVNYMQEESLGSRRDALINASTVGCMHCVSCLAYAVRSHIAVGEVNGRTRGNT